MTLSFPVWIHIRGEILSVGIIKVTGEELYLEIKYKGEIDPWVAENIIPTLKNKKVSRVEAVKQVKEFVGDERPYMVTFVNSFDDVYLHKLFRSKSITDLPFYWMQIDFGSILFGNGINPKFYNPKLKENFFKEIGVDASKYTLHNALDDAKLLREVYLKMTVKQE